MKIQITGLVLRYQGHVTEIPNLSRTLDDNRYSAPKSDDKIDESKTINTIKSSSDLWSELRNTVSGYIKSGGSHNNIIVFDVHSFPHKPKDSKIQNHMIYVLDYLPYQNITLNVIRFLKDKGYDAEIYTGKIGSNSILDILTLHPLYMPTILIEISESLTSNTLTDIAKDITGFLKPND